MKAVVLDEAGALRARLRGRRGRRARDQRPQCVCRLRDPDRAQQGLWLEPSDGRRWLNTGDLGRQDADGYFYLTGRKKELIIRGGHNIDPASIEEPLHRAPGRADCRGGRPPRCARGRTAGRLRAAQARRRATEEELLSFARDQIGERAAMPKAIRHRGGHAADRRRQDLQARAEAARDRGCARRGAAQRRTYRSAR